MTEQQIIQNCKKGNQVAFRVLVDTYAPKLKGICLRYMKDEFKAQDVLQNCFILIFRKIDSYKEEGSFEGWMSKIAVRCALQELRKNTNKIVYLESYAEQSGIIQDAPIEQDINEQEILQLLRLLPDHYRVVFNLFVIEGYSHKEIGDLMGIGESSSRTKLTRARKKLQELYRNMTQDLRSNQSNVQINKRIR